jgi:hypothetical protein
MLQGYEAEEGAWMKLAVFIFNTAAALDFFTVAQRKRTACLLHRIHTPTHHWTTPCKISPAIQHSPAQASTRCECIFAAHLQPPLPLPLIIVHVSI